MTALFGLLAALFGIVFDALVRVVKTVFLTAALIISLFFGAIMLVIYMMQR